MFKDRKDAGIQLGKKLVNDYGEDCLVLAIPKGGIEVGYEVARQLKAAFSVIIVRKLPMPDNPETGFGAIAEDGSSFIYEEIAAAVSPSEIAKIKKAQTVEIHRRLEKFRNGKPLPDIRNKTIIVVDDGIATGSTMRAALRCCRNLGAAKCVAAAPVAGTDVNWQLGDAPSAIVIVKRPIFFRAVAQVYANWYDVPDEEALWILQNAGVIEEK